MQVLNLLGNHWIVVFTIGCSNVCINVYDSLHMALSCTVKKVIADVLRYQGDIITIYHCDVQWQMGGNDCGFFAVAFATALCTGHDPVSKVYNQSSQGRRQLGAWGC